MNRVLTIAPRISQTCLRRLSTSNPARNVKLEKIKKYQKVFQEENDVPIFLKAGTKDYLSFYGVLALTLASFGMSLTAVVNLSLKK